YSLRRITSGPVVSITSTGDEATPLGKAVVDRPSAVGRAPVPPAEKKTLTKRSRPAPRTVVSQIPPAPSAITRPGRTRSRAPKTACGMEWPAIWRGATAGGKRQLKIDPSGAVTDTGRKLPSL